MSQFLTRLGVLPPSIHLWFTDWVAGILPVTGENGVPDIEETPAQCFKYLDARRTTIIQGSKQRPLIRVADKNLAIMMELEGELSLSTEELSHDTGQARIKIRYTNWIADWMVHQTRSVEDLHLLIDWNPTNPNWRTRWGGKIDEIHIKHDEDGTHSIELHALSFREHAKRLLFGANPIFPPEVQLPKMWVLPGPCRSILSISMFINLARLFFPVASVVTNIFNPAGWINPLGPDALLNFDPLAWPLQVQFVNILLDQSRWTALGSAWTNWHESMKDLLMDAGVQFRPYTYLTTDEDSPHTELTDLIKGPNMQLLKAFGLGKLQEIADDLGKTIDELTRPVRNCIVFALEDKSGVTGPTGTVVDGALQLIGVTLDNLITPVTLNLSTGSVLDPGNVLNGETLVEASGMDRTYLVEQLLDVAPNPPKVIWWEGQYNGLVSTDLTFHKGSVKTVMTGGRSPTIVNEAQTFAIRYGLSQLGAVINEYAGVWAGGVLQAPGGEGLDNLYQGQLDNVLLAWQRFTDPIRALHAGDFAWQEHFEKGTGTAYTLASVLTLRAGNFKTRDFAAFKATTINGHPWMADVDFSLGDRLGFEEENVIYVDQCTAIKRDYDRTTPLRVTLSIGDDRNRDDPFAVAFKTIGAVWSLAGQILGEGTLFG